MVAAPQGAEAVTALFAALELGLEGHLQGHFHGGAAIVRKEGPRQVLGQPSPQSRHQLQGRFVREAREHHVVQPRRLALQGTHQARMPVAVQAGPPAGDAIQHPLPVAQQQVAALATHHWHRRIRLVHLHLREGVPHMGPVQGQAVGPVGRERSRHGNSVGGAGPFRSPRPAAAETPAAARRSPGPLPARYHRRRGSAAGPRCASRAA